MSRTYEALYILNPALTDEEITEFVDMIGGVVEQNGGTVLAKGKWDKRKLAYEINHFKEGTYCLMYFDAEGTVPAMVNRAFRINDDVIRGMITLVDKQDVDTTCIKCPSAQGEEEKEAVVSEPIVPEPKVVMPEETAEEAAPAEEAAEPTETEVAAD